MCAWETQQYYVINSEHAHQLVSYIVHVFFKFHFNTEMGTLGLKISTHINSLNQVQGNSDIGKKPQILEEIMFWQIKICVELMLKFSNLR